MIGLESLVTIFGLAVAGAAMISAAILSAVAIRFSGVFLEVEGRLKAVERWIEQDQKGELAALRAASEMLRQVLDTSYKVDMTTVEFLNAQFETLAEIDANTAARLEIFRVEVAQRDDEAQRYLQYLALLREGEPSRVKVAIDTACERYPDELTITFLEAISPLLAEPSRSNLNDVVTQLKVKVRGIDARRWSSGIR